MFCLHMSNFAYFQNMVIEGTISRNVEVGPIFYFMSKNGNFFVKYLSRFHKKLKKSRKIFDKN